MTQGCSPLFQEQPDIFLPTLTLRRVSVAVRRCKNRYCRRTAMGLNFARLRGSILCGCQICGSVAWCVPSHSLRSSPPTGRGSSAAAGSPSLDVFRRANYDQLLCVGGGGAGVWSILSLAKLSFPKQRRRLSYRVSILCNNAGSGD